MSIKKINLILFVFLSSFVVTSTSHAKNNDSLRLLKQKITHSIESCPRNSMMLNCKSYRQTTQYSCGPAAVMELMNYYGKLSNKDMNQQTELRIANEMGLATGGTSPSQVINWLENHGFRVSSGEKISTDMLIENIKKGIPTLIAFDNHWMLAKGYEKGSTPNKDQIFFADSCCNMTIMSRNTIDSMWVEAQMPSNRCGGNKGIYIVAIP